MAPVSAFAPGPMAFEGMRRPPRYDWHGGRWGLGFKWQKFGVVWADVAISGFRYLIPDTGDLTERFGDDQPRVV